MQNITKNLWRATLEIYAESFDTLKATSKQLLKEISSAKSFKDLPHSTAQNWTGDMGGCGYSASYVTPVELRIKELRKEADELERSLVEGK